MNMKMNHADSILAAGASVRFPVMTTGGRGSERSPRVTKKQKRLSTMVSMMASMSVSWMSALLMAVGEKGGAQGVTLSLTAASLGQ